MANTNFLQFDANGSNMLSDEDYASDVQRQSGVVSGIARSTLHNKQAFQASTMVKALADLMVDGGQNVMDNNLIALKQAIKASFITAWNDNIFTGNNTFSGNNTFTGSVSLGSSATATTKGVAHSSTAVATTAYVKSCVPKSVGSSTKPVYSDNTGAITACDLGIPDYTNRIQFTTTTYTPTKNGIIRVRAVGGRPMAAIKFGSFYIARSESTDSDDGQQAVWAIVRAGEEYTIEYNGSTEHQFFFIPFK